MGLMDALRRAKRLLFPAPPELDPFPIDAWTDARYQEWLEAHKASNHELDIQRSASPSGGPLFSVIVPLYRTPLDYLAMMVNSVLTQTYERLELVLVNASPENGELKCALGQYAEQDERIRIVTLSGNRGITENTNAGIEASNGEFLCFLDHDDCLEPNALFEYAKAIDEDPEVDVLYCDEDLMIVKDGDARYVNPLFKPELSPELLLCKNYIVHLMCVRRSIIDEMDRPDSSFDGAQDYNMVLFATSRARKVHHVSRILYHWRISETSTAANPHAKPYSRSAYRKSAFAQINRNGEDGRIIASGIINIHNIWFRCTDIAESVSVIVAVERADEIKSFLQLFEQTNSYGDHEVIFVGPIEDDDLSSTGVRWVHAESHASLFERLNKGAQEAQGDYLLFMEGSSFFLTPEPLEQLVSIATQKGIGAVSPKTLYADGSVRCYGVAVTPKRIMPLYRGYPDDFPGYQCNLRAFQNNSAASYLGLMTARSLFEKVGGFDPSFEGEIGTADYCRRIMNEGQRIVQMCTVKLQSNEGCPALHYDNATNAADFTSKDLEHFDEKWPGVRAAGDPYFNKNLDQSSSYFQIAEPYKEQL